MSVVVASSCSIEHFLVENEQPTISEWTESEERQRSSVRLNHTITAHDVVLC